MNDLQDIERLRSEVREWLRVHVPQNWRAEMMNASQDDFVALQQDWFRQLAEAGYATPHWPAGWAGGGRSLAEQKVIFEEIARADAPRLILPFVSLYHAASTLFEWGSEEQKRKYLPEILDGALWCQGFSEPNAGSDLAALSTRATRRGDHYVVTGQKIWSSMSQYAQRCILLARTSSEGPPQAGLTFLFLDMRAKGITIRPIEQISGEDEFCEVFLDEVEVPVEDRCGEEGEGWAVAQSTLASERGLTLVELSQRMRFALPRLAAAVKEAGRADDALLHMRFGSLTAKVWSLCAVADAYLERRIMGQEMPGDASIVKLSYSRTLREFTLLGLEVGGLPAQYHTGFMRGSPQETGMWMLDFMNSYNWTIAGGSDEIQRKIISEKLLGIAREPKNWRLEAAR